MHALLLNTTAYNTDLDVLECVDGSVRLEDGETATEGRVEVCQGGRWGTICNDLWSEEDTDVVCGELRLLSSGIIMLTHFNINVHIYMLIILHR